MTREIKFRAWSKQYGRMLQNAQEVYDGTPEEDKSISTEDFYHCFPINAFANYLRNPDIELMQYTGLKDKNGLQEVYEGDIIDEYGNIKGNTYEMDAGETDFIIQGLGDKNWGATYKEAVGRGCTDTQRYADTDEVRELD